MMLILCAVRQRPDYEILEVTVPAWEGEKTKRRLAHEGWETVFVLRVMRRRDV